MSRERKCLARRAHFCVVVVFRAMGTEKEEEAAKKATTLACDRLLLFAHIRSQPASLSFVGIRQVFSLRHVAELYGTGYACGETVKALSLTVLHILLKCYYGGCTIGQFLFGVQCVRNTGNGIFLVDTIFSALERRFRASFLFAPLPPLATSSSEIYDGH